MPTFHIIPARRFSPDALAADRAAHLANWPSMSGCESADEALRAWAEDIFCSREWEAPDGDSFMVVPEAGRAERLRLEVRWVARYVTIPEFRGW